MKHNITEELNVFLKGNLMAIHAYDNYIHRTQDTEIKQYFQQIQKDHKQHATMIAERIQDLGGIPVDDVGLMGNAAEFMHTIKSSTYDPADILEDALVGEHRGIEKSKELLNGDLDPESLALVEKILNVDERHVDLLDKLSH